MPAPVADITEIAEVALLASANLLVPWYLISSFAYYILDDPVITDELYDRICRELLDALDCFEIDHPHMDLCDMDALRAGSCYHLTADQYPSMARSVANRFVSGQVEF